MDIREEQSRNQDYERLITTIKSRRSCRRFLHQPVDPATLEKLVEAAIWAPTGCNQQEVRFVLVTKREDLEVLLKAKKVVSPQAAILIYTDTNATYYKGWWDDPSKARLQYLDAGAAAMNIILAAESLGLGALWVNVSPYWQGAHGETVTELYKRFDVPNTCKLQSAVYLGYPATKPDLAMAKWHGKPVMREKVSNYIVTVPRKTAILHYQSPDHDNMGSRALSEGLLNLAREKLGETNWIRLFNEYPVSSLLNRAYLGDNPDQALARFEALTNATILRLQHAHEVPEDSFSRYFRRSRARLIPAYGFFRKIARRMPWKSGNPNDIYAIRKEIGELRLPAANELFGYTPRDIPSLIIEPARTFTDRVLGKLVSSIWGMRHMEKRLFELARFDTIIYNGNGYFADYYGDALVRRLFELHVGVKLGKEVVACNLSVDLKDEVLRALTAHVFHGVKKIVVREPLSRDELLAYGLAGADIVVGADAAIFASVEKCDDAKEVFDSEVDPSKSIALILRGDRGHDPEDWIQVVQVLREKTGTQVVLLSSSLKQDTPLMSRIAERTRTPRMVKALSHPRFIGLLSRFSLVISERYHPCVFCIRTQTPVVPLVGNTLKTEGLFSLFPYSISVLSPDVTQSHNRQALYLAAMFALENKVALSLELAEGYRALASEATKNIEPCLI